MPQQDSDYRLAITAAYLRGETSRKPLEANEKGEQLVAQGLPPYTEMARKSEAWSAIATAAIAALIVRPSTVAAFTLFNNYVAGGKSLVIDRLFTQQLVSAAAQSRFGIWATVHPAGMTNPGIDIAASATNLTGNTGKTYNGNAVVGVGETVVDNGWYPWGNSVDVEPTGVLAGAQLDVRVEGRIIIPPQAGLSLHIVASSVNEDFCSGCSWTEEVLNIL